MPFDAVAYINEPRWAHSSLGLERMQALMELLGSPQGATPAVHVAGTNGKGSTCMFLASMLQAAGYRTGLFTSPAIMEFAERIQVDGRPVDAASLAQATLPVRQAAEAVARERGEHPTEFELMAAVAFEHFKRVGCDIAVIEVGLGGRLDATNVVAPVLSVITRIGLDHTALLGDTLAQVASEKAGIIKAGVPVVGWPQGPEAQAVIEARCAELGCPLAVADLAALRVGAVAAEALGRQGWAIPPAARQQGIAAARWPGRFEVLPTLPGGPTFVVDGGHNAQGAAALVDSLADVLAGGDAADLSGAVAFVVGAMEDKDYTAMLAAIAPMAKRLVAYAPDSPRALAPEALAAAARAALPPSVPVEAAPSPAKAVALACDGAGEGDLVVAFGSLYGVADVKRAWQARVSAGG